MLRSAVTRAPPRRAAARRRARARRRRRRVVVRCRKISSRLMPDCVQADEVEAAGDDRARELGAHVARRPRRRPRSDRRGRGRARTDRTPGTARSAASSAGRVTAHLQAHGARALQAVGQVVRRVLRDHPALVDDDDAPAGHRDLGQDVRGEHDGVLAAEALDQLAGLDDLLGVEAGRRLVEDQHVGVVRGSPGRGRRAGGSPWRAGRSASSRTSATRRLLHRLVDARALRSLPGDALDLARRSRGTSPTVHVGVEGRRLRHVADAPLDLERLLEDVVAGHARRALRGREVAGEDAHGGRLARPRSGPRKPRISPLCTRNEMPSTAVCRP